MAQLVNPIFIGGSGRSGTSLLFLLVERNNSCYGFSRRETKFIIAENGLVDLYYSLAENYNIDRAKTAIKRFKALVNALKTDGTFYKTDGLNSFLNDDKLYDEIVNDFIDKLWTKSGIPLYLNEAELLILIRNFLTNLCVNLKGYNIKRRFVEKTPHNFLHLNFLNKLFPDLKFLHIVRDPRGVAYSLTKQNWAPNDFEQACFWLLQIYEAFVGQKKFSKHTKINKFYQLKLEDLANENKEKIEQELSSFLRLKNFEINSNDADINEIDYWKNELTKEQIKVANFRLGKYINYFGYQM